MTNLPTLKRGTAEGHKVGYGHFEASRKVFDVPD